MKRACVYIVLFLVFVFINRALVLRLSNYRYKQKAESGLFLLSPDAEKLASLDYEGIRSFWITLNLRVLMAQVLEKTPYFPAWVGDVIYKAYNVASELNPYFFDMYYISSLNLMWDFKRYDDAAGILKKAIKYRKDDWMWYFFLSFDYFYFLKKYDLAALYMTEAAKLKKSAFLASLASRLYYADGRTEIALMVLDNQIKHTKDEHWKKELIKRKKAFLGVLEIQRAMKRFKKEKGREPSNINELLKEGYLDRIPKDPYGGQFYIEDGKVKSTSNFTEKK